ncbi:MAG: hypothetical protein ACQEUT_11940 [Bacillota bacterium]
MKKLSILTIVPLVLIAFITWVLVPDFEFGNYDTFQEAIQKGISYEVEDIIHIEEHEGVKIILYSTIPDMNDLPSTKGRALGMAFFEGNDQKGWNSLGNSGWRTEYDHEDMTVYEERLMDYDKKGDKLHELHVVFGKINNPEIVRVETKAISGDAGRTTFEPAKIVNYKEERFYFQIGEETIVRGLSEDGTVVNRQGG